MYIGRKFKELFYLLIKTTVRLALRIFCRRICLNSRINTRAQGPVLITANHPNSFLDAVIIGAIFNRAVHYLTRGDAFNRPWHDKLLRLLNMIPVYRLTEGKENLSRNEEAFRRSKEVLSAGGIVLIFIEGICKHTHELQPFKKGAARIALDSSGLLSFRVVPLGIAYNSFDKFGKYINIDIGEPLPVKSLLPFDEEAKNMSHFNSILQKEIGQRIAIPAGETKISPAIQLLFFLPAMVGILLHLPLYALIKNTIRKKTAGTVFFDSVLFGVLLFVYPLYLLVIGLFLFLMQVPASLLVCILFLHPLTAWCAVWWKTANRVY